MIRPVTYPNLLAVLERGLRAEDDTWDKSKLHVSDVSSYGTLPEDGGWCPRTLFGRLNGWDHRDATAGELLMFNRGHSLHEEATRLLRAGGIEREGWTIKYVEKKVREDAAAERLGVLPDDVEDGQLDIELEGGPGGDGLLTYDYKTTRGRAFDYLPTQGAYTTHKNQVGTYEMARGADGGGLLYLDREGQNFGYQENVDRRDEQVMACVARVKAVAESVAPPPVLPPEFFRRENKGPDSLYLEEPFQCRRCVLRDISCPGALKKEHRDLGIVAKIDNNGTLLPQTKDAEVLEMVERYLWNQPVAAGEEG